MNDLKQNIKKNVVFSFLVIVVILIIAIGSLYIMNTLPFTKKEYYTAKYFHIKTIYSTVDFNHNGLDDYSDFVLGSRKDSLKEDNRENLEIEVIRCAFLRAGYDLTKIISLKEKDLTKENVTQFLEEYAQEITTDTKKIEEFQPGDIVLTEDTIGILSDKRNEKGLPFYMFIEGYSFYELDVLDTKNIKKHYRFDASQIDATLLNKWK